MSMRARVATTTLALASLLVLVALVLMHTTARLDADVEAWAWARRGSWTTHLLRLASWASPTHVLGAVAALVLVASVCLRSVRPALVTAAVCGTATVAELGLKWSLPRIESHLSGYGAAGFPSGHVVAALAYTGALVVALRLPAWLWGVVAVLGLLVSATVVLTTLHTPTEVAGSWALCGVVLAGATMVVDLDVSLRRFAGSLA